MKRFAKASFAAAVLTTSLLATTACSSSSAGSTSDDTASTYGTIKPGVLTIATSSDLTPFAYIKDKEWVGVDVALVTAAAKNIGLDVEITAHEFDTLIPLVAGGQADLTMGSIADTDVRRKTVDFTLPDIIGNNALVVPQDSKIATEDDVAGKKIGILQSSQALQYAQKFWTESNIVTFPSNNAARLALSGGGLDAILVDPQNAKAYTDQFPMKVALSAVNPDDRGGAWIVNKEDEELRVALNQQLRTFLADGTTQKILDEWNPADDSQPVIDWLTKYYAAHPSDKYSVE
ncbi:polar amino acid transport system substrate-binding protein [Kineococcus radiotolerans]|uniref:Polar amino acid transport system substrate-binding protein n=1 Tax=Kineococcus radiotolerans TaxID=131568 RepID=A0A7W4TR47_KINRA|nr:ABC transporter substrate-binding protein [Kineococcus radiotolerans]MBB2903569.1 polar amino acid transport system substrate-binding protein [Kineococcus radiotolerans]